MKKFIAIILILALGIAISMSACSTAFRTKTDTYTYKAFYGSSGLTQIYANSTNAEQSNLDGVTFSKDNKTLISCPTTMTGSYKIPDGVTHIDHLAFSGCSGLTSVIIPDSVTHIGISAFSDCSGLTSLTLPNSLTHIAFDAFWGCTGLTSMTIPYGVNNIWSNTFNGCSGLKSVTIPDSVTRIGWKAFSGCTALTSVTIPENVFAIDSDAFSECTGLEEILVHSKNKHFSSHDGVLFDKDEKTLIRCPGGKSGIYKIPWKVTSIGPDAFSGCAGLTSIVIPDSVIRIDQYAFANCTGLESIVFNGNAPVLTGDIVLNGASSGVIIYYPFYRTGYSSHWQGYPTRKFIPTSSYIIAGISVIVFIVGGFAPITGRKKKIDIETQ